jgi:death-on-curing protein
MAASFWYPAVEDVLAVHDDVVSEYPDTPAGVRKRGDIEYAVTFVEAGGYGETPETVHQEAFDLLRLLVANHPFVDANKRTALNTTATFYFCNDHRFEYGDEIRAILKQFATDEAGADRVAVVEYLRDSTDEVSADTGSPLGEEGEKIRLEQVRQVATADREANREIYDALEDE